MTDQAQTAATLDETDQASALVRRIAFIALAAIVLGFAIQGLILATKLSGGVMPATSTIIADATQGITWSLLVCVGVGIVTSVSKARPLVAGLVSLLVAPLAVALAKSSQKVMSGLVSAAEQEAMLSLSAIASLKAVEYGVLGWMLARLVQQSEIRASRYFGTGGLIGLVFGGAIVWIGYQAGLAKGLLPGTVQIVASLINEVLFPIGCSAVIYAGQLVGRSARLIEKAKATAA
jgi:hypothetical protein